MRVSLGADYLFRCLLVAVDDYGRFDARPEVVAAACYPMRREITLEQTSVWLGELETEGCIQTYEANERPYLHLTNWERHRSSARRAARSKYPAPGGDSPAQTGFVYCIRRGDDGPVKIGWALSPKQRLETLQAGNDAALNLLGCIPGGRDLEAKYHNQFTGLRIRHEWFKAEESILSVFVPDVPEIRGIRGIRGIRPSVECRVSSVEKKKEPRRSGARVTGAVAPPEGLSEEAHSDLYRWAGENHFTIAQTNHAIETVLGWGRAKGKRMKSWQQAIQNGMRAGWALPQPTKHPPSRPCEKEFQPTEGVRFSDDERKGAAIVLELRKRVHHPTAIQIADELSKNGLTQLADIWRGEA